MNFKLLMLASALIGIYIGGQGLGNLLSLFIGGENARHIFGGIFAVTLTNAFWMYLIASGDKDDA